MLRHFSILQRLLIAVGVVMAILGTPFLFRDAASIGVPLLVFGSLLTVLAVLNTTYGLHRELSAMQRARADLMLFYREEKPMLDPTNHFRRIGVLNRSEYADATAVEVKLLRIVPEPRFANVDPLPCRIGRMNAPDASRSTEVITMHPLDKVYFDLFTERDGIIYLMTTEWLGQVIELIPGVGYTCFVHVSAGQAADGDEASFQLKQHASKVEFRKSTPDKASSPSESI